jgi:hypothetical protein
VSSGNDWEAVLQACPTEERNLDTDEIMVPSLLHALAAMGTQRALASFWACVFDQPTPAKIEMKNWPAAHSAITSGLPLVGAFTTT